MADVVKTTCWLANVEDAPRLGELFAEAFGIEPPARSTPIVALPRGLLLSIEAIAVCDGS